METSKSVKVRQAVLLDLDVLISMGRLMHQESPRFKDTDFSEASCKQLGEELITAGGVFIAEKGEEAVGMFAGALCHHYFGSTLMANDYLLYVKPQYRAKSRAAYMLLKEFEKWAIASGAKFIQLGISTQVEADRTRDFYERMGYPVKGYLCIKEIV